MDLVVLQIQKLRSTLETRSCNKESTINQYCSSLRLVLCMLAVNNHYVVFRTSLLHTLLFYEKKIETKLVCSICGFFCLHLEDFRLNGLGGYNQSLYGFINSLSVLISSEFRERNDQSEHDTQLIWFIWGKTPVCDSLPASSTSGWTKSIKQKWRTRILTDAARNIEHGHSSLLEPNTSDRMSSDQTVICCSKQTVINGSNSNAVFTCALICSEQYSLSSWKARSLFHSSFSPQRPKHPPQ